MNISTEERFWRKVNIKGDNDCWEWKAGKNRQGYGHFHLNKQIHNISAHRAAWILVNEEIPEGMCVCHTCDNCGCVNPKHLFLGTNADNSRDMKDKGRQRSPVCEDHGQAKLTNAVVLEIRSVYNTGKYMQKEIAHMFNMSPMQVSRICRKQTWKHI